MGALPGLAGVRACVVQGGWCRAHSLAWRGAWLLLSGGASRRELAHCSAVLCPLRAAGCDRRQAQVAGRACVSSGQEQIACLKALEMTPLEREVLISPVMTDVSAERPK
ncbi:hypothetical protein NDU88_006337 [Pleurodeles waltl]|uniref:Uncharacterized protein n=1 Tax=Pleurodeles waltl TaxID=8319 RepID=A0AAV7U025_PLEWA|nr:hypothetical protein NDU88_006337 [Pleurodeles waltl]